MQASTAALTLVVADITSENLAFFTCCWYDGNAMAAKMPTMATTIINSMSVKPF